MIKGQGLFEKSRGIDRIFDIGVLLHKVSTDHGDYLHVVIDKHRFPSVVDTALKSFFLEFPNNKMPIPANVDDPYHKAMRKIPRANGGKTEAFFNF